MGVGAVGNSDARAVVEGQRRQGQADGDGGVGRPVEARALLAHHQLERLAQSAQGQTHLLFQNGRHQVVVASDVVLNTRWLG